MATCERRAVSDQKLIVAITRTMFILILIFLSRVLGTYPGLILTRAKSRASTDRSSPTSFSLHAL
jgi:hypothetical protein